MLPMTATARLPSLASAILILNSTDLDHLMPRCVVEDQATLRMTETGERVQTTRSLLTRESFGQMTDTILDCLVLAVLCQRS
jgi:hypothetical protein